MTFLRAVLFIGFIASLAVTAFLQQDALIQFLNQLSELDIRIAVPCFLLAFVLGSFLLVPSSVFLLVAGAIFGLYWGYLLGMAGFTCGALSTFLVSRYFASEFVGRHLPGKIMIVIHNIHQHGWKLIATLRLVGIIPAPFVNYAMGITRIGIWEFTWASCVFTLPIGFMFTYAGTAGKEFIESGDLTTLVLALPALTLVGITIYVLRHRYLRKQSLPGD